MIEELFKNIDDTIPREKYLKNIDSILELSLINVII